MSFLTSLCQFAMSWPIENHVRRHVRPRKPNLSSQTQAARVVVCDQIDKLQTCRLTEKSDGLSSDDCCGYGCFVSYECNNLLSFLSVQYMFNPETGEWKHRKHQVTLAHFVCLFRCFFSLSAFVFVFVCLFVFSKMFFVILRNESCVHLVLPLLKSTLLTSGNIRVQHYEPMTNENGCVNYACASVFLCCVQCVLCAVRRACGVFAELCLDKYSGFVGQQFAP